MAQSAVAHEAVRALRLEIARLEGRPGLLPTPPGLPASDAAALRRDGALAPGAATIATGAPGLDAALGGGLPGNALLEVAGAEMRGAGTLGGFGLILAALLAARRGVGSAGREALLWIGTHDLFHEAGLPYLRGLQTLLGGAPDLRLFLARAKKPAEALWIAEEAAGADGIGAVLIEAPDEKLGLAATRRLHFRAQAGGRAVILLRYGPEPQPTAAPLRLRVGPAPAAPRLVLGRALAGTIGKPCFTVTVAKSRLGPPAAFILEWNAHEHRFAERGPEDPGAVVSSSRHRADQAPAARTVLAFKPARDAAAFGDEPPGEEQAGSGRARRGG